MKMRFTVLLALVGVALGDVHQFRAENKFVCTLCKESVRTIKSGHEDHLRNFVAKKVKGYAKWIEEGHVEDVKAAFESDPHATEEHLCISWCEETEEQSERLDHATIIEAVNSDPNSTWVAGESHVTGLTKEHTRIYLGSIIDPDWSTHHSLPKVSAPEGYEAPASFDPRTQWPKCANIIGHIRDQSSCGSCWAFGSTEAFNDRHCIQNQDDQQLLSTRDTAACCNFLHCFSQGCNGGQPSEAWSWFTKEGVVSGGDYDDIGKSDMCEPYPLAPCSHHVTPTKYPACPSSEYHTPSCVKSCPNSGYAKKWQADKNKASKSYGFDSVAAIQADMEKYGTVTAAFTVYADFPTYKSGVYTHKSGQALGGHAIKIVGWGSESGTPYWLVANSWNETWGDHGYFKILRGQDECGIESQVSAGRA